jgi:hypothetical protein
MALEVPPAEIPTANISEKSVQYEKMGLLPDANIRGTGDAIIAWTKSVPITPSQPVYSQMVVSIHAAAL